MHQNLRRAIIFIGGYAYDSHSFLEKSEYQVLRLGNIKNDTINKSVNPVFIDEILAQDTVRFRCLKNDILVTMTGTRKKRDYFYTVLIDTDHSNMYFNQRVGCLRAIYSPIALWLNKVLKAETILHQVFQYETGTANQGNLGASNIMNTLIPLPPVTEQFRIVKKLEEVHTYVFQYDKAQCELDILNFGIRNTIKKSLVQEAIQGKLVPQITEEGTAQELLEQIKEEKLKLVKEGKLKKSSLNDSVIFRGGDSRYYEKIGKKCVDITEEIPFDIPGTWEWCRLGTLFSHCTGKALNASNLKGQLMTYITTSNLYWDRFELGNIKQMRFTDEEIEKCTATFGDLLVCEGGDIGRAAIWNYPYDIRIQNHIHKLRAYKQLCTKFFFWVFYFYKATGRIGGKGIGIQGLSSKALDNILIPLPPLKEQQRIVAQIEKLFEQLR